MSRIPIFAEEECLCLYIQRSLNLKFEKLSIEEVIVISKTAKYKDFANSFKISSFHPPQATNGSAAEKKINRL